MDQGIAPYKICITCVLLIGAWAVGVSQTHKVSKNTPSSENYSTLAESSERNGKQSVLPPATGNTLSDKMIAKWSSLVQHSDKDDMAWTNLGDSYMQKARETADVTYYSHAEQSYQRALALNKQNVPAMNGMAWVNGGRHEFEKSIEWAEKAIAIAPKDNDAYGLIGDADVEMGNYDAAFTHYQHMLDIRPDTSSYSRGAHLLWLMGDQRKATWLMEKAIKAGSPYAENTAWCRSQLALMLISTGALVPAEQTLQNALKYTPHNYQLLAAMGKLKSAQKNYPSAIEYYKQAAAIVPIHDSLVALGDLYQATGKPEDAKKQFALVEATHRLLKANGVRGDMQIALYYADHDSSLAEAVREEEEEYRTRPNVYVADTLAWCYYKVGRYTEARALIGKVLSHNTPEAGFMFHAGMIDAKLNYVSSAKVHLYQALNQNSNFSILYAPIAAETLKQLGSRPLDADQMPSRITANQQKGVAVR